MMMKMMGNMLLLFAPSFCKTGGREGGGGRLRSCYMLHGGNQAARRR